MSTPLYSKCELCNGTLNTTAPVMVDGLEVRTGEFYSGPLARGSVCPCTTGKTPGFSAVGLTMGQIEAVFRERDELKKLAKGLADRVADQSELLAKRAARKDGN